MPKYIPKVLTRSAELERERLNSLINSMGDGVIALDEKLHVVVTNGAAQNILDINTSLSKQHIYQVMHLVDENNQPVDVKELILSCKVPTISRDYKLVYSDKATINLYLSIAPVRLGFGHDGMRGYVVLIRDITREKSLEEERDEFISVVSHELRTPITIAEGNISNAEYIFARSGQHNEAIEKALQQAHSQTTFLAGLINDLATLSRAERGKLAIEPEQINVAQLVEELTQAYRAEAEQKGLELRSEIDPHLELLYSSKLYVREVLQNFVTNAIKYTEKGHVCLGARARQNGVEFYVSDTGIGISKADQEKVFDKFFRSEDFRTRANSGTGLGLYVTMKLARMLKAEIHLESHLNKGSTFTIFIPNVTAPSRAA